MSETIAIAIGDRPDVIGALDAISSALHVRDLRSLEDVPEPGTPWPLGVRHLFRDGVSTRTTEITCEPGRFSIRIFSMATPEDVALAVALAEYIADDAGVTEIDSESGSLLAVDELPRFYDADWALGRIESGYRVLSALVRDGKGPVEVPGPNRTFCVGPRVLLQLGPEQPHLRLLEQMRRVQWIPVRTAATFVATAKSDHREIKLAMWLGEEVFFPSVDYAGIAADPTAQRPEVFLIPYARVAELAGDRWTPVDERQGLLADCTSDWPELVTAARRFETVT